MWETFSVKESLFFGILETKTKELLTVQAVIEGDQCVSEIAFDIQLS